MTQKLRGSTAIVNWMTIGYSNLMLIRVRSSEKYVLTTEVSHVVQEAVVV